MTEEEIQEEGIDVLPNNLLEAVYEMEKDELVKEVLEHTPAGVISRRKRKNGQNIPARFPDGNWISIFTAYKFSSRDGS